MTPRVFSSQLTVAPRRSRPATLTESRSSLEALIEFAPDAIVIVSRHGHIALVNNLPPVRADGSQIELIVGNLVANAVQAMPGGGTLTLETGVVEGDVRLTVGDTGVGISADGLGKVFEPLFTTKAKGLGLGLSVARRLATVNGATLSVTSVPGQGSRFAIRFSSEATETSSG